MLDRGGWEQPQTPGFCRLGNAAAGSLIYPKGRETCLPKIYLLSKLTVTPRNTKGQSHKTFWSKFTYTFLYARPFYKHEPYLLHWYEMI
jgi:hypothetical protein